MVVVWRQLVASGWWLAAGLWLVAAFLDLLDWFTWGAKLLKLKLGCRFWCFGMQFGFVSSRNLIAGRIQLSSLKTHISLIWHRFWLKFGAFVDLWVRNPKKLSLHQLDIYRSRYWILNGQRSTLAECKFWLWRMWFPSSLYFYFSWLRFPERYGCYLSNSTGITSFRLLELTLCTKHRLRVKSANYLQFTPFCIFHLKVPSKHKTKNIKAFYT